MLYWIVVVAVAAVAAVEDHKNLKKLKDHHHDLLLEQDYDSKEENI